jgi:DNA polymerase-3 subunit epsilon
MFQHLKLNRPLAVLDLETTGGNPNTDRIVEISIKVIGPDGSTEHKTRRVNPQMKIDPGATKVHGITDEDVKNEPTFKQFAKHVATFLDGCDLCGFNLKKFDLRILVKEFERAGVPFTLEGRRVLDVMEIYHFFEKRTLEQAVRYYLGRDHDGAHSSAADVSATAEVLDAMIAKYSREEELAERRLDPELLLSRDFNEVMKHKFNRATTKDSSGFFVEEQGELRFVRGKHRGAPLSAVVRTDVAYLEWMLNADFAHDTKAMIRQAMNTRQGPTLRQVEAMEDGLVEE